MSYSHFSAFCWEVIGGSPAIPVSERPDAFTVYSQAHSFLYEPHVFNNTGESFICLFKSPSRGVDSPYHMTWMLPNGNILRLSIGDTTDPHYTDLRITYITAPATATETVTEAMHVTMNPDDSYPRRRTVVTWQNGAWVNDLRAIFHAVHWGIEIETDAP